MEAVGQTGAMKIDELEVADSAEAWRAAGFTVDGDVCNVGSVRIRLADVEGKYGILGWSMTDLPREVKDIDGVPTGLSASSRVDPSTHLNGVTSIDHVVLMSPNLTRTRAELAQFGLEPRRERDGELGGMSIRQIFYRFDDVIVEVVGDRAAENPGPSSLWGITFNVADIDASAAFFGERTGRVKDAVQPGRRITTLRHRDLNMSVRTALISER